MAAFASHHATLKSQRRREIVAFLTWKWAKELDCRLIKELRAFDGNRIVVRFACESRDDSGNGSARMATRIGSLTPGVGIEHGCDPAHRFSSAMLSLLRAIFQTRFTS